MGRGPFLAFAPLTKLDKAKEWETMAGAAEREPLSIDISHVCHQRQGRLKDEERAVDDGGMLRSKAGRKTSRI